MTSRWEEKQETVEPGREVTAMSEILRFTKALEGTASYKAVESAREAYHKAHPRSAEEGEATER